MRKLSTPFYVPLIVLGQLTSAATAQTTPKPAPEKPPSIVISGIDAYRSKGSDEGIRTWLSGSPFEGSRDALIQANTLRSIQDLYGTLEDFTVIGTNDLTPRIKIIYITLNYEKGPVYGKFNLYRVQTRWIVDSCNFNIKEDVILPAALLSPM